MSSTAKSLYVEIAPKQTSDDGPTIYRWGIWVADIPWIGGETGSPAAAHKAVNSALGAALEQLKREQSYV